MDIDQDAKNILESIDGMLVIDRDENLVFMCKKLMDLIGVESFDYIKGKKLRDVIATNLTWKVLETGERQIGVTYLVQGYTIVSNSYPIYKGKELIGALEYDVFEDLDLLMDFMDKMSSQKGLERFGDIVNARRREKYTLDSIKGSGTATKNMKNEILLSSRSNSTVLITGETGTGKELIAQSIHMAGNRSLFEFVEVNCPAIPHDLFESELFGYEEGSFTGAKKGGKKGLVRIADKGTLFLDEVSALPMMMQAKLLRFLQEREFRPVGGDKPLRVDVRVISASNEDLPKLIEEGKFREDLYYRLNVIHIKAEPLRNRLGDIPELVYSFIDELNGSLEKNLDSNRVTSIENEALKLLMDYHWPGNIRELKNVIERGMNRCSGNILTMEDLSGSPELGAGPGGDILRGNSRSFADCDDGRPLSELRAEWEASLIRYLLDEKGLTAKEASERLGITRQMFYKKMRDFKIERKP